MAAKNSAIRVIHSRPGLVKLLEAVQRASFSSLAEDELITAKHYAAHIRIFPEGQLCAVNEDGIVVGCSTDFRTKFDFKNFDMEHRYIDAVDNNWLGSHDPDGDWLYGADIGVLPEYRRRGIGTMLYRARHRLVRDLGLRGHVAGGMLSGYRAYKEQLSVEAYVDRVIAGKIFDPTLSVQLKLGFTVQGIIQNYVNDPICDNKAALIVWRNPDRK